MWTVDLINNVATYICNEYYLPDGYYFENNIGRTDINLVQKTENIWAQTEQSIVLYPNPARDICYLDPSNCSNCFQTLLRGILPLQRMLPKQQHESEWKAGATG